MIETNWTTLHQLFWWGTYLLNLRFFTLYWATRTTFSLLTQNIFQLNIFTNRFEFATQRIFHMLTNSHSTTTWIFRCQIRLLKSNLLNINFLNFGFRRPVDKITTKYNIFQIALTTTTTNVARMGSIFFRNWNKRKTIIINRVQQNDFVDFKHEF